MIDLFVSLLRAVIKPPEFGGTYSRSGRMRFWNVQHLLIKYFRTSLGQSGARRFAARLDLASICSPCPQIQYVPHVEHIVGSDVMRSFYQALQSCVLDVVVYTIADTYRRSQAAYIFAGCNFQSKDTAKDCKHVSSKSLDGEGRCLDA